MLRQSLGLLVALTALVVTTPASAQAIRGALRLHLETSVLGFSSESRTAERGRRSHPHLEPDGLARTGCVLSNIRQNEP